ncbi:MAG: hypothetical protein ABS934_05615 [Psychrobacillus sp.]
MKVSRSELQTNDDIWNAVLSVAYVNYPFPTEDEKKNDIFILFSYYSEMESGGHEALLNWLSETMQEMGIPKYVSRLTKMLKLIGAYDYAVIENSHLEEILNRYVAIENSGLEDPDFEKLEAEYLTVVERADKEYRNLDEQINECIYNYAVIIHEELLEKY